MKVIVLGGGVIGTTTAYYLAKLGHEVHLVDRQDGVALETSFANGGVLHTSEAEPWSRPGMPTNIWNWLGKEDAPMLLRYGALPGMWRWGLAFLRNCTLERYRRSTTINLRLSFYTLKCFAEIGLVAAIDYDQHAVETLRANRPGWDVTQGDVREFFPPGEAGVRVGTVLMATVFGMALGGWMSGVIFDLTGSYQAAFANGILWNLLNIGIAVMLLRRPGRPLAAAHA